MKRLAAPTAITLLALVGLPQFSRQAQAFETGHELAAQCASVDTSTTTGTLDVLIPGTPGALECWGYMHAMQDLVVLVDRDGQRIIGACPNEQTTILQITRAFTAYANRHSNELDDDAALIVVQALRESFPCP